MRVLQLPSGFSHTMVTRCPVPLSPRDPELTERWDVWVARFTRVSTWCYVTTTQIFDFAQWVVAELTTWANQLQLGSVGLLQKAWACTLARSFGVACDNTGVSILSPFFDNWSYRGFEARTRSSIVRPVFTHGVYMVSPETQRTRLLCDLLLSLDCMRHSGHLLFSLAGRDPAREWVVVSPPQKFSLSPTVHRPQGKKGFLSGFRSPYWPVRLVVGRCP